MVSNKLLVLAGLLVGAWAQSTTEDPTSTLDDEATATKTGTAITTHTIAVGASGHKFTPTELKAEVGDILEWRFYPTNHWVIRGDFDHPCIPYDYVGTDRTGFSSGDQSVQAITDDGPRFRVRVNNTDPIFFYCGAPGSCVRYHMMGVVNPSKNETLDKWLTKADDVDYQLRPGDPWPTESDFETPTAHATPDATNGSDDDKDDSPALSAGAIAGIAIGGAAVLILGAGLIYLCGRRGGFDKAYRKSFSNFGGSSAVPFVKGSPSTVEAQFGSPHAVGADAWKVQPSPMVAHFQSPPISPQPTGAYSHYGTGTMMSTDGTTFNTYYDAHGRLMATPPPAAQEMPPAELATSADPGNSPLPTYSNGQTKNFSWTGAETGYRSGK